MRVIRLEKPNDRDLRFEAEFGVNFRAKTDPEIAPELALEIAPFFGLATCRQCRLLVRAKPGLETLEDFSLRERVDLAVVTGLLDANFGPVGVNLGGGPHACPAMAFGLGVIDDDVE